MTLFWTKNLDQKPQFQNKIFRLDTFFVSSYFASHPITVLLKIFVDGYIGRPPPQILGDRPRTPTKSPLMILSIGIRHAGLNTCAQEMALMVSQGLLYVQCGVTFDLIKHRMV